MPPKMVHKLAATQSTQAMSRVPTYHLRPGVRVRVQRVLGGWHPARHRRGSELGVVVQVQGTHLRGRGGRVYRVTVDVPGASVVVVSCQAGVTWMTEEQ